MAVLNSNTEEPNVVHVYCDNLRDTGVVKLHTPLGMVDIEVDFSELIELDVCHEESVRVNVYRNHMAAVDSGNHYPANASEYDDPEVRKQISEEFHKMPDEEIQI